MKNLDKAYGIAAFYPAIIALITCLIYSIIEYYNYKSEWLKTDAEITFIFGYSFLYIVILCILSLSIYLNTIVKLQSNFIWNILTWFLLPYGFITIYLTHEISYNLEYNRSFGSEFVFDLLLNVPFIIGICWSFIWYKTKQKQ